MLVFKIQIVSHVRTSLFPAASFIPLTNLITLTNLIRMHVRVVLEVRPTGLPLRFGSKRQRHRKAPTSMEMPQRVAVLL